MKFFMQEYFEENQKVYKRDLIDEWHKTKPDFQPQKTSKDGAHQKGKKYNLVEPFFHINLEVKSNIGNFFLIA